MPIYEFACTGCRVVYSFFARRVDTKTVPACPRCGKVLTREVSAVAYLSGEVSEGSVDEGRMASAMEAMGDELEGIGEGEDSKEAAEALSAFSEASGMKFNRDVRDAVERIASGEDADVVGAELESMMEGGASPFEGEGRGGGREGGSEGEKREVYVRDPTLYDL